MDGGYEDDWDAVAARKKRGGKRGPWWPTLRSCRACPRRRRRDRVAFAGDPRGDNVHHCARGGPVRPDGIGTEDGHHMLAAERDGVLVHRQRQRPDVQAETLDAEINPLD